MCSQRLAALRERKLLCKNRVRESVSAFKQQKQQLEAQMKTREEVKKSLRALC